MVEEEFWRDVVRLPHYEVSNLGNVGNKKTQNILKPVISDRGTPCVTLYGVDHRTRYFWQVNQIVAQAWLPPSYWEHDKSVWHIDGDLLNCRASNLRWESRARVIAWNDMHKEGGPKHRTGPVRVNATGEVFDSVYHLGLTIGDTELSIIKKIESGSSRYSYL